MALKFIVYVLRSHNLLASLHPTIGLVIGIHFFPLARLFDLPATSARRRGRPGQMVVAQGV